MACMILVPWPGMESEASLEVEGWSLNHSLDYQGSPNTLKINTTIMNISKNSGTYFHFGREKEGITPWVSKQIQL